MPMKCLVTVKNILHLAAISVLSCLCPVKYSLFGRNAYLFSFIAITFEIVHISESFHNVYAYEVLTDSHKYFTFGHHTCFLTYTCIFSSIHPSMHTQTY